MQILQSPVASVNVAPIFAVAPNTTATPKDRFSPLPNLFVDAILPQLTCAALKAYCYMQRRADRKTGRVVCSYDEIADACGKGCQKSAAQTAVELLESFGVIVKVRRNGYRPNLKRIANIRNEYQLTAPDYWKLPVEVEVIRSEPIPETVLHTAQNQQARVTFGNESTQNQHAITNAFSNAHISNNKQRAPKIETPAQPEPCSVVVSSVNETATAHKVTLSEQQQSLIAQMQAIGVKSSTALQIVQNSDAAIIEQQLQCLDARQPRNAAATLVKSIRENWGAPQAFTAQQEAAQNATNERARRMQAEAQQAHQKAQERARMAQGEAEAAQLDKLWLGLDSTTRERIETAASARLLPFMRGDGAKCAMCRTLLQQWLETGSLGESGGLI